MRGFCFAERKEEAVNVFEILGALNGKGWFRFLPIRCPRFAARRRRSRWCLGFWDMTAPALRGRIESRRQRRGSDGGGVGLGAGGLMGWMGGHRERTGRRVGQPGCCFGLCWSQPALRLRAAGLPDRGSWAVDSGPGFPLRALPLPLPNRSTCCLCWVQRHSMHTPHGKENSMKHC